MIFCFEKKLIKFFFCFQLFSAKMRAKIRLQSETSNLDENNDESTKEDDDIEQTNTNNDDDIIEDELEDIPL